MKRAVWIAIGVSLGLCANAAASAFGLMGDFRGSMIGVEWHSRCSKPSTFVIGKMSQQAVDEFNRQLNTYYRCLKQQADNDAEFASSEVYRGAEEELEGVKRSARLAGFTIR